MQACATREDRVGQRSSDDRGMRGNLTRCKSLVTTLNENAKPGIKGRFGQHRRKHPVPVLPTDAPTRRPRRRPPLDAITRAGTNPHPHTRASQAHQHATEGFDHVKVDTACSTRGDYPKRLSDSNKKGYINCDCAGPIQSGVRGERASARGTQSPRGTTRPSLSFEVLTIRSRCAPRAAARSPDSLN